MKILIAYGTKTGTTQVCAEKIKEYLPGQEVELLNLEKHHRVHLGDYDAIVVGSPLYMGQIRNKVSQMMIHNKKQLLDMKVHLFVCGLARGEEGVALLRKQVPGELFGHAVQIAQLGGEVHIERLNFIYRWMMKKVMAESKPEMGFLDEEIQKFAKNILEK